MSKSNNTTLDYAVCLPIKNETIEIVDPFYDALSVESDLKDDEQREKRKCLFYESPEPEITLTNEQIINGIHKEINKYRRMHCACRLVLTDKLNKYAQIWADELASEKKLETRCLPRYGESILRCRKKYFDITRLIRLWYQEKYNYKYAQPKFDVYSGHFTQMVWCATKELGVGIAQDSHQIWIVCNYRPPGNIKNYFHENVLPRRMMLSSSNSSISSGNTSLKGNKKCKKDKQKVSIAKSEFLKKPPDSFYCGFMRKKCESCPDFGLHTKQKKTQNNRPNNKNK